MNSLFILMIVTLSFLFILLTVCNCRNCINDYKRILQLSRPVQSIRSNQVYPIPVVYGVRVYGENENIQVIDLTY
jgi:hypothetical protein